ncbi:MAG: hypothetical protein AB1659_00430 [Thermodesulfobacteriota bacterium]
MTRVGDIVLIFFQEKPISFARIEEIEPDDKRGWYKIKLFILQIPLQCITWILKQEYLNGAEFTMGGNRMRLEKMTCPEEAKFSEIKEKGAFQNRASIPAKVIDFKDPAKKK